jgi:hypothetical protein
VLLPLLGFNVGVEARQIAAAGIVLPILQTLRANPIRVKHCAAACSAAVALVGISSPAWSNLTRHMAIQCRIVTMRFVVRLPEESVARRMITFLPGLRMILVAK